MPVLALNNLRIVVIVIVVAVHAVMAYLGSSPASSFKFDDPPYRWRSIPIVDPERWFGFDIFCGFQDIYLISLLFFLSGLFVWPSLARSGSRIFLRDRILRIGIPFALTVGLLMPLAHYPVYRVTAVDPSLAAYWQHWLALPFWPSGPPWFLWVLLVFDIVAAGLFKFGRISADVLGEPLAGWAPAHGRLSSRCCRLPRLPTFRRLLCSARGTGFTSGRSRSNTAGRCIISSISSPVPASAPMGSIAACWRRTDGWRSAGRGPGPPRWSHSCCGSA